MIRATSRDGYVCTECGWTTVRWVGRCGQCHEWGSVVGQAGRAVVGVRPAAPTTAAVPITSVPTALSEHRATGMAELDRVLGGGLVPGAVILLAGEPGVGKSTLLLEMAARWAGAGRRTLYVTGEESAAQVRLRAGRTLALADELFLAAETDLGAILGHIDDVQPSLLVLDSIQTVSTAEADGVAGGVTQVRGTTSALVRMAKRRSMPVVIVGHVTKEGTIAGPRTMEHLVDVVLNFEGDRHSGFRMVRATKNRFGAADEVGCFEMAETGIVEVPDPSGLFTSTHSEPIPGSCLTVTLEGRRPLLAEIQALVAPSTLQQPRRITHGVENGRIAMLTAVLQRRLQIGLGDRDIYASTVGGVRIADPASDLACALAIASAATDRVVAGTSGLSRLVAIGEVGLAGELRRISGLERRLAEAARLGFDTALVPAERGEPPRRRAVRRLRVIECATLAQALQEAMSTRPSS